MVFNFAKETVSQAEAGTDPELVEGERGRERAQIHRWGI